MPHRVGGPPPTAARQGREQQKYTEDGARAVAGCIPVRYSLNRSDHSFARVLMITSRSGKGYVFPKGGWEVDESVEVAAQRETVEEAGVRGILELPILGTFPFRSGKAERQGVCAQKGRCLAYMFAMEVSEELLEWPEGNQRQRVWCTIEEAYEKARYDWMREALRAWVVRQGWIDQVALVTPVASPASRDLSECMPATGSPAQAAPAPSPDTPIAVQN